MEIQELKNVRGHEWQRLLKIYSSDDDSSSAFKSLDQPEQFKELDPEMPKVLRESTMIYGIVKYL